MIEEVFDTAPLPSKMDFSLDFFTLLSSMNRKRPSPATGTAFPKI